MSRFVSVQKEVRSFIGLRLDRIREAVKANYMMPEATSGRNEHMARLRAAFEAEFADNNFSGKPCTWEEVKAALWGVFENLRTYVVNSKSDEVMDFSMYENAPVGRYVLRRATHVRLELMGGAVTATLAPGRIELLLDCDFTQTMRPRLESAIAAFYAALR